MALTTLGSRLEPMCGWASVRICSRRAVGDEDFIDLGDRSALGGAGVELAIGKGARAAFAETVVGFLDHPALAQQRREIKAPGTGILAAL